MKVPKNEQLKGHSFYDIGQNDQAVALAHGRNVILLDRWGFGQGICEDFIYPQLVLAYLNAPLKSKFALPAVLIDLELHR